MPFLVYKMKAPTAERPSTAMLELKIQTNTSGIKKVKYCHPTLSAVHNTSCIGPFRPPLKK